MNLTETPEVVSWPETGYAFVEKTGPFRINAPAAWQAANALRPALSMHNSVSGALSLYRMPQQIYRAGFALEAPPAELPAGLAYELFPGGSYCKFTLTGPYSLLPQATSRVFEIVAGQGIALRDDFYIEHYVSDPRDTPEERCITEILVPVS